MTKTIFCISLICVMAFGVCFSASASASGEWEGSGASGSWEGGGELENPTDWDTFEDLINSIIGWIYDIGVLIAVLMIIYSGFLFMTSAGNEIKLTKAKNALIWSLVGLGILLMANSLIILIKSILNVTP